MYDRDLLLMGEKRNAILDLWEVQRYGIDSYGDPDYVSIYRLRPEAWFAQGIRLLGRTAVECTRDGLGDAIGAAVARIARSAPRCDRIVVIDPFTGSGNTLYWLLRHLPGARGIGFELDDTVFKLTAQNLAVVAPFIDVRKTDYRAGLAGTRVGKKELLIAFIAPPWGDALDRTTGLDLRRTTPPIGEIVDLFIETFPQAAMLFAIQVHERVEPRSLNDLKARFDGFEMRVYDLNAPGDNHGTLLATRGWTVRA